jgi:hypothetical protein
VTDTPAALIELLMQDSNVNAMAKSNIFDQELSKEVIALMPCKAVLIEDAGGFETNKTDSLINPRFDIKCYGENKAEARKLAGSVYDCLQSIERKVIADVLIHSIGLSPGLLVDFEMDTGWPMAVRSINVLSDDSKLEEV